MVQSFAYYITMLHRDFAEYCNRKLQEMGLSQGLLFFILYIGKHPGCSPKKLSEELHMDSGHTARSLARLEQAGLILQEQNPKDRRAHVLLLTEDGREVFMASHDLFTQWDEDVLGQTGTEERERLILLLQELVRREGGGRCVRSDFQPD